MSTMTVADVDAELGRLALIRKQPDQQSRFAREITLRIDLCLDTRLRLARQHAT